MKQRCWKSAVRCGDVHAQQRRSFPAPKPSNLLRWWLTDLLSVRKEEILGLTVLLISFKQYDRVSRPNLGEGGPLAGEGAGGVEKGGSVEGDSLRCKVRRRWWRRWGTKSTSTRAWGMQVGVQDGRNGRGGTERKQQSRKKGGGGEEKDTVNTWKHTTEPGGQHRSKPSTLSPQSNRQRPFYLASFNRQCVTMHISHHGITPAGCCFKKEAVTETLTRRRSYFGWTFTSHSAKCKKWHIGVCEI